MAHSSPEKSNSGFATGHRAEGRAAQIVLKREIAQAIGHYKKRVVAMFQTGYLRQAQPREPQKGGKELRQHLSPT